MIIDADQAAALESQAFGNLRYSFACGFKRRGVMEIHSSDVRAQVINVQPADVPKGFFIEPDMRAFIDVARHTMRGDADLFESGNGLWRPGGTRLAVTGKGAYAHDPADVRGSFA